MIEDCKAGKIDMILTKSISRFSRNTVDCLKYTRLLKDMNIAVFFEKENINTLDAKGEVLMTIMAALAQQESESLSANVRLGMIGVSVHSVEEAKQAVRDGADCLGVGAMFSTSTKTDVDVLPKETLKAICDAVDIPVVAIGGLNKSNILELSGTGVDGVALVSAIFSAEDIESECRGLRALSEKMVNA